MSERADEHPHEERPSESGEVERPPPSDAAAGETPQQGQALASLALGIVWIYY